MNAVDTNVLIYAHDPRDPSKQQIAVSLINSLSDPILLWQVACEYLAAGTKLEAFGFDSSDLWDEMECLRRYWTTVGTNWDAYDLAHDLRTRYSLSFWDSLLIATAIVIGVERPYSEDFDGYTTIDGLELINPFATTHLRQPNSGQTGAPDHDF